VVIVDDDLGRSGGGAERPGFERLLLAICEARVGIVLAVEASRLARNGRDWHTLLEFCGLVGCLLADEDGVYDPRLANDRLLLGRYMRSQRLPGAETNGSCPPGGATRGPFRPSTALDPRANGSSRP
jgi:hypothetical protein